MHISLPSDLFGDAAGLCDNPCGPLLSGNGVKGRVTMAMAMGFQSLGMVLPLKAFRFAGSRNVIVARDAADFAEKGFSCLQ